MLQRLRAVRVSAVAIRCVTVALAAVLPALAPAGAAGQIVERVVDGDTIIVRGVGRVRLIGVDTPETVAPGRPVEFFGREASAFAKRLLEGRRVRLEYDRERTDRYGRTLAYVHLADGTFANAEIIRRGLRPRLYAVPLPTPRPLPAARTRGEVGGPGPLEPGGVAALGGERREGECRGRPHTVGRQRERPGHLRRGATARHRARAAQPSRLRVHAGRRWRRRRVRVSGDPGRPR